MTLRGGKAPGVIMHTDQGSEYTARAFQAACHRLGIAQSIGRPGSALDNAVIEFWHSPLEFELRRGQHFATKTAARAKVAAWIEVYNTKRRHTACGRTKLRPRLSTAPTPAQPTSLQRPAYVDPDLVFRGNRGHHGGSVHSVRVPAPHEPPEPSSCERSATRSQPA
jgi:transposase InsO family protein